MPAAPTPCDAGVVQSAAPAVCSATQARWVLVTTILGSGLTFLDSGALQVLYRAAATDLDGTRSRLVLIGPTAGTHSQSDGARIAG